MSKSKIIKELCPEAIDVALEKTNFEEILGLPVVSNPSSLTNLQLMNQLLSNRCVDDSQLNKPVLVKIRISSEYRLFQLCEVSHTEIGQNGEFVLVLKQE